MDKAVLIIAHGSTDKKWVEKVDDLVSNIQTVTPVFTAFIENVKGRLVDDVLKQLNSLDIKKLLVVPLFVSSASNHIKEIKEFLKQYQDKYQTKITSCIDDDDYVVEHIIKSIHLIAPPVNKEQLLLVAHGSKKNVQYKQWTDTLERLTDKVRKRTNFSQVEYATIFPNTIEELLSKETITSPTLVIPLFLSRGYYTEKKIPEIVKEYKTIYISNPYIEGDWISKWIEKQIKGFSD